jgi:hypothetical protein
MIDTQRRTLCISVFLLFFPSCPGLDEGIEWEEVKLNSHQNWRMVFFLVGDLLALLAFVYIGQRDHGLVDVTNPLWGVLWTALPFALVWLPVGLWLDIFPRRVPVNPRSLLIRSLNAWLVAAPLGVVLRAFLLGRAVIPTSFLVATLGFGGLFVLGWRLLFVWAAHLWEKRQSAQIHENTTSPAEVR